MATIPGRVVLALVALLGFGAGPSRADDADPKKLTEQMEKLLGSLDEEERQIVEMKLQDLTMLPWSFLASTRKAGPFLMARRKILSNAPASPPTLNTSAIA